jgi:hypothetical protein
MNPLKILIIILISVSCSNSNQDISFKYISLEPKEKHTYDSDEYFLSNVFHIDYYQNNYVLVEYEYNRITLLNKDHTVKATITPEGNELTDVNYPMKAHSSPKEFAIFNAGNKQINFYDYNGKFQSTISLKSATSGLEGFSVFNNKIYHSVDNGITPYVRVNLQTNEVKNIGQFHPSHTTKFAKIYKSIGQIFELRDQKFVTVLSAMGEVILYNSDSEILSTFNINEIDEFKTTARLLAEVNSNNSSNSVTKVFGDSKLVDNKLYILAIQDEEPETPNKRNFTQNHIIQLKIEKDNSIQVEKLYQLNGAKYFKTFAVADDNTITVSYGAANQLWTYELQ